MPNPKPAPLTPAEAWRVFDAAARAAAGKAAESTTAQVWLSDFGHEGAHAVATEAARRAARRERERLRPLVARLIHTSFVCGNPGLVAHQPEARDEWDAAVSALEEAMGDG